MLKKVICIGLLCQLLVMALKAQDIYNAQPVVLPQSPATAYTVSSGQTVKISSKQSVTLGPGVSLEPGSNVTVMIANSPVIAPAPYNGLPNFDKNWIQVKNYDESYNLIGETKDFFDNSGKLLQNQMKSVSAGHVLASQPIYDVMGRAAVQTLAAPINSSDFSYAQNFVTSAAGTAYTYSNFDQTKTNSPDAVGNSTIGTLGWYYSNSNTIDPYVSATSYPYSRTDFYKDGTGAAKRSAQVGDQLKMGLGRETSSYTVPVANELDFYIQVRNKFFSSDSVGTLATNLKKQAVQNVVHDANGREAVSIADKSGNVLMVARPGSELTVNNTVTLVPGGEEMHYFGLLANSSITRTKGNVWQFYNMSGDEQTASIIGTLNKGLYKMVAVGPPGDTLRFNYTNSYSDITCNFYNQLGQLIVTIAPNGVKKLITDGLSAYATLVSVPFVTRYKYDAQGRLIAKSSTDEGTTEFVYRKDGSVRFSQNPVQRIASPARFSYTNYDRWGRSIESGEYVQGSITFASTKTNTTLQESVAADGGLTGGTKQAVVKTQYDTPNTAHAVSGYTQDEGFLRGAVSYTENSNAKTWYNYDGEGRIAWVIKQVTGLDTKTIDYTYDAKGNVAKVDFQKDAAGERFIHEYEYDADNRLKVVYTSTTPGARKEQARYYYYLHGPLKRVELADNLQGIDYTYTAQGMLKSINHPVAANDPGKDDASSGISQDVFGMTLEYFSGDYSRSGTNITSIATRGTADYSGNIIGQSWRSQKPQAVVTANGAGVNDPAMFTYSYYDKYQFGSNKYGVPNFTGNSFTETLNANKEHSLAYDANGNITTLKRNNAAGTTTANYTYNYLPGTNKLSSVNNYASYTYDALGQMASQVRTAGNQGYYVDYDVNGKVTAIYSNSAKTTLRVSFAYDESGNRIKKTDHIQNTTTYYVYDIAGNVLSIYDNVGSSLQQKELPVYAASRVGIYNRPSNSYKYELTDNLGNVRVVINGTKKSNGEADVVYYSDYYPFGSPMTLAANDYRYGYQGQYAEVDKETGWDNFDLRMYDAEIGRWMSGDPYGQYHSPYLGMGNNPVSSVDPDGGYSIIGAFIRQVGSFLRGENPTGIYHNGSTWGFNTRRDGEKGFVGHFADAEPSKLQSQVDQAYALLRYKEMGLPMYNGRPKASGRAEANYFFEEMVIGGAVGRGVGLAAEGLVGRAAVQNGGRVFWSGEGAMDAAMSYAKSTGGTTLEMTRAGQNLQKLIQTRNIPWSEARPMWQRLSTKFAQGAEGSVHFFPGKYVNPGSIWLETEKPILLERGISIIVH